MSILIVVFHEEFTFF